MASTQQIKARIKSVKSTRQITKAMELVSASKMRRAQEGALASREYARTAEQVLTRLRELTDVSAHPLYHIRPVKGRLYIVITSDRGLAGAYNSNVLRTFATKLKADQQAGVASSAILVGKQAGRFAARLQDLAVLGAYDHLPEKIHVSDLTPILQTAKDAYLGNKKIKKSSNPYKKPDIRFVDSIADEVEVIYTDYKSSIVQQVTTMRLLPAAFTDVALPEEYDQVTFEPSPHKVLGVVTERLVEVQLLQMYLESQASEQSARMMAMKTASDNAADIIEDLTLAANTLRQASITQELAEITGGVEAMK